MKAAGEERRLLDHIADFIDGFKEIRLNRARSNELFSDALTVSRNAANIKIRSQSEMFKLIASSQGYMYILLGTVVLSLRNSAISWEPVHRKITTALFYIIGACFGLVQSIPVLTNANAAPIGSCSLKRRCGRPSPPTRATSPPRHPSRRSRCTTSYSVTWMIFGGAFHIGLWTSV